MEYPEGLSREVHERALHASSELRSKIFSLCRNAAGVWGTEGVIEAMNEAFCAAILSAVEEERDACIQTIKDESERLSDCSINYASSEIIDAIRNRKGA